MTDIVARSTGTKNLVSRSLSTDVTRERSRQKSRRSKALSERECSRNGALINNVAPAKTNGHLQRPLKMNHCMSDSTLTYTMDVAAQPPKCVRPGVSLPNPLSIWLRATMSRGRATDMSEVGRLFAVATLTTCNGWSANVPVSAGVLTGQKLVDSVHPVPRENTLRDIESNRGRAIGYFSFPNLAIRQEGVYRIRITLIRVSAMIGEGGDSLQGGLSIHAVDSSPVIVDCRASAYQDTSRRSVKAY